MSNTFFENLPKTLASTFWHEGERKIVTYYSEEIVWPLVEALKFIRDDLDKIGVTPTEICHLEKATRALTAFRKEVGDE